MLLRDPSEHSMQLVDIRQNRWAVIWLVVDEPGAASAAWLFRIRVSARTVGGSNAGRDTWCAGLLPSGVD